MTLVISRFDRRDSVRDVADRWKSHYSVDGKGERWRFTSPGRAEEVYRALVDLGQWANPDDVDKAIGNNSWTHVLCDGCSERKPLATTFETDESYIVVCDDCAKSYPEFFR